MDFSEHLLEENRNVRLQEGHWEVKDCAGDHRLPSKGDAHLSLRQLPFCSCLSSFLLAGTSWVEPLGMAGAVIDTWGPFQGCSLSPGDLALASSAIELMRGFLDMLVSYVSGVLFTGAFPEGY